MENEIFDFDIYFIDLSKLQQGEDFNVKNCIIYFKDCQNKEIDEDLNEILLTLIHLYKDSLKNNKVKQKQKQIVKVNIKEIKIYIIIEQNYALISGIKDENFNKMIIFINNLVKLLEFLFESLENSFLKHRQEVNIIIVKALKIHMTFCSVMPSDNTMMYLENVDDTLTDFVNTFNRIENEFVLISHCYLLKENNILSAKNKENLLEVFLYHCIIQSESGGIYPRIYFHKMNSNLCKLDQFYSLFISNCFITFVLFFNCQIRDLKSPPITLIRNSRVLIRKFGKQFKLNLVPLKLINYHNIDDFEQILLRRGSKLLNWFKTKSSSFSVKDRNEDENNDSLKILMNFQPIYSAKYRNLKTYFKFDFPFKNRNSDEIYDIKKLNNFLKIIDDNLTIISKNLNTNSFEVDYFLNFKNQNSEKNICLRIAGIYDGECKDSLIMTIRDNFQLDMESCLKSVREFLQSYSF